ncbi:MAG TPA: class I SAM-dependent methyltransferase [Anaerolineales bacterium]|nr:class I SAM-dependent methyltransferase [Anaerolineales bacterium]
MNFFEYKTVAERYAKSRPYFHPLVTQKVKAHLGIQRTVNFAIDVGCGPGQSTVALKEIADFVIGADISAEMLGFAEINSGIQYIQASAEGLPIQSRSSDLLISSLAFHWFNQERFLAEARRVLKDKAWLIISNNGFTGQMIENPTFEKWIIQVYERQYPSPPRNSAPMTAEIAQQHGFNFAHEESYQNEVLFTVEQLSAYLITQSNVIAATEQGKERIEDVYLWLNEEMKSFFPNENATFTFGGYIWYLQKTL